MDIRRFVIAFIVYVLCAAAWLGFWVLAASLPGSYGILFVCLTGFIACGIGFAWEYSKGKD